MTQPWSGVHVMDTIATCPCTTPAEAKADFLKGLSGLPNPPGYYARHTSPVRAQGDRETQGTVSAEDCTHYYSWLIQGDFVCANPRCGRLRPES